MKKMNKKEDQLISGIMKDMKMESPSTGFTERVMQSIHAESSYSVIKASPLISRAGWIGIAAGICMIFVIVFMGYDSQDPAASGWLMQFLPSLKLPEANFSFEALFSWSNIDNPTLFWIFISIAGFILLAFLQRIIENLHIRQDFIFHSIVI